MRSALKFFVKLDEDGEIINGDNPIIIARAKRMKRSVGSLAKRLLNYLFCATGGKQGLGGGGRKVAIYWAKYAPSKYFRA